MKIEILNRWTDAVIFTHEAEGATMRDAVLAARASGANLRGANLSGAYLRGADLRGANLSGAYLRGAYLSDAYLSDADLSGAYLSGAYLRGAYLSDANLSDADLRGANLSGAYLRGAYLSDANLSGADLSGAYLSGAYLRGAYLSDANLRGANLSDANLSGAYLRDADLLPIRDDIWAVLSSAPGEVQAVIDALKGGRVDGSTYKGSCSCLVGTIGKASGKGIYGYPTLKPNSSRPAERFFMGIRSGDTPETSQFSALALEWSQQWLDNMKAAFGAQAGK